MNKKRIKLFDDLQTRLSDNDYNDEIESDDESSE